MSPILKLRILCIRLVRLKQKLSPIFIKYYLTNSFRSLVPSLIWIVKKLELFTLKFQISVLTHLLLIWIFLRTSHMVGVGIVWSPRSPEVLCLRPAVACILWIKENPIFIGPTTSVAIICQNDELTWVQLSSNHWIFSGFDFGRFRHFQKI